MSKRITIQTTEVVTHSFTFDVTDDEMPVGVDEDTRDEALVDMAEEFFVNNGPNPDWFFGVDERRHYVEKIEDTPVKTETDDERSAAERVKAFREKHGTWADFPGYPDRDWRDDETRLGYWDWVVSKLEEETE